MTETTDAPEESCDSAQAAELALLIDLEARWENLRIPRSRTGEALPSTVQELHDKQKAYEGFRTRLAKYNKRYKPAHATEVRLDSTERLGKWCRRVRDVFRRVEGDPKVRCPTHLLEKAYRWADRLAARGSHAPVSRPGSAGTIHAALGELEGLAQWCDDLGRLPDGGPDALARGLPCDEALGVGPT